MNSLLNKTSLVFTMKKKNILEVKNISFKYTSEFILKNISFSITKPELIAVVGPNGSGKSTLVKLIAGILKKNDGSITTSGKIAYIPQKFNQDPNFPASVKELLDLECCRCSIRDDVVKSLNLESLLSKQFKNLSGGQQQRVFVAMALLSEPEILILDEPTVGIDTKTQEDFFKLLKKLHHQRNLTILFVTHDTGMISTYFTKIICVGNKEVHVDDAKHTNKALLKAYGETFDRLEHNHSHGGKNV